MKTSILPDELPAQLLCYIEDVRDDEHSLKEVMIGNGRAVFQSWRNGRAYEFVLNSTEEQLDVKAYNMSELMLDKRPAWLKSGHDCILVARGRSLLEPVIIGRNKAWPLGLLNKGKQGFLDNMNVTKRYAGGAKLTAYVGNRGQKSVHDDSGSDSDGTCKSNTRQLIWWCVRLTMKQIRTGLRLEAAHAAPNVLPMRLPFISSLGRSSMPQVHLPRPMVLLTKPSKIQTSPM